MMVPKEEIKALFLQKREKAFEELYEQAFPPVALFVNRMGGTFEDAKDNFQDSLIVFYEKTMEAQKYGLIDEVLGDFSDLIEIENADFQVRSLAEKQVKNEQRILN